MTLRSSLWIAVFALAACKGKTKEQPAPVEQPAPPAAVPAPTSGAVAPPGRADPAVAIRAEATAFLTSWTLAQNQAAAAVYFALYEPHTFRGVKRTADGKVREFDFAGWKQDRGRMFKNKFDVAAELLGIETWLDAGAKLKRGMVILRFTQRWRGGDYADHGVKVLHLWRGPGDIFLITYEDLLNSEPGWDRTPAEVATTDLAQPKDQTEALALWRTLAPTGADYLDKLASLPDDPAVRRPMARALLATGNVACTSVVEYAECGDERVEWADLDPKADLDDPCLRRRLAEWALDEVTADDLVGLDAELAAIARIPLPETELPEAVSRAVSVMPDALRLTVIAALMASDREDLIAVDGLSRDSLIAAARLGVDAAALALDAEVGDVPDPDQLVPVLAELVASTAMTLETRHTFLATLAPLTSPTIDPALIAVTDDEDCELAMAAAEALAARGAPSRLPQRHKGQSLVDGERAICMLMHDTDSVRADARLTEYIGPAGATVTETIEDPWAHMDERDAGADDDDDDEPDDAAPDDPPLKTLDEIRARLDEVFGVAGSWERHDLIMTMAPDGAPSIASFDFYRYNGCGC